MGIEMSLGDEAEQYLASLTPTDMDPQPHECLRCFVRRRVSRQGCDGTLRLVRHWLKVNRVAPAGVVGNLQADGGYCDCEVVLNVFGAEIAPSTTSLADCPSSHPRVGTRAAAQSS
ncbi:MAG TPA: DUF2695 domain-containing protein [Jiangellaceae bacterium]|nr:DUF2695 domain-containing protein [Jiangellaceae bacterium]